MESKDSIDNRNLDKQTQFMRILQTILVIDWEKVQMQGDSLGKGSYGTVKKVSIPNISKPLAMKILKLVKCQNEQESELQFERIHREIQLLQSCTHPNILSLYGISINYEKTPFQIGILTPMKWGSLAKLLEIVYTGQVTEGNLPEGMEFNNEAKQKIIFGISAGLFYLHSKNIIHRDVKPENILLDDDFNPLLCDFGFAKETVSKGSLSQTGNIGTPLYEAPEIFLSGKYSEKVDIYSWAIVVNSILREEMPWKEIFDKDPDIQPLTFLLKIKEGIRPQLIEGEEFKVYQELIQRGWNEDPNKRPTAKEIIEILMKKEAMLPGVNEAKFKEYEKTVLTNIPAFSITIFEKLEKLEKQLEEQPTQFKKPKEIANETQPSEFVLMQLEEQRKIIEKQGKELTQMKKESEKQKQMIEMQATEIAQMKKQLEELSQSKNEVIKQEKQEKHLEKVSESKNEDKKQQKSQQIKPKSSENKDPSSKEEKQKNLSPTREPIKTNRVFKIVLLGSTASGKTSIIKQVYKHYFFPNQPSTTEPEFYTLLFQAEDKIVTLQIWDLTIQHVEQFLRNINGALLVFDLTNRSSLEEINTWLNLYRSECPENKDNIVLVGNKTDVDCSREISLEEAQEFAKLHQLTYIEVSAKTGAGVHDAFERLTLELLKNVPQVETKKSRFSLFKKHSSK